MNDVSSAAADRAAYSGFWRRFAAWAIDYVLLLLGSIVLRILAPLVGIAGDTRRLSLVILAGYFIYCTLLESSPWQATIGKRALGLKVTNRHGGRIGFARAAARFVAKLLSVLTLFLGYLLIVVTHRRQALHDLIVGTLVAHDGSPRRPAWVVAPLAAVGCLPFLGVLGAIALPAYQDMTIRAQVVEGLRLANGYGAAIESSWRNSQSDFANVSSDSLRADLPQRGPYVESIEVVSGIIVITYGEAANGVISGRVLSLVPALDSQRALAWACGYGQPPPGFKVIVEDHRGYSDIDERFLPSACRSPR